jgi:hypothetical protein
MTFLWGLFLGFVAGWIARSIRLMFDPRFTLHLGKQINAADLRHIKVSPDGYRHSKYPNGDAPPSEWKCSKNN